MKKYIKMWSAVALAAFALMATVGGSSASAKACSTAGVYGPCTNGKEYTGTLSATLESGTYATLNSGFMNVTCTNSTINGEIASNSGSVATGWITAFTLSTCSNNFSQTCTWGTSASTANKWHFEATTGTVPNGHLVISNLTFVNTCGTSTCHYKAAKVGTKGEISVTGGEPATFKAEKIPLERESVAGDSSLCSTTVTWGAAYNVTTPASLYLE